MAASTCARSRQGPCETECPYKGTTSEYWSARVGDGLVEADIAWAYDFPTRQLIPITGSLRDVHACTSDAPVALAKSGGVCRQLGQAKAFRWDAGRCAGDVLLRTISS